MAGPVGFIGDRWRRFTQLRGLRRDLARLEQLQTRQAEALDRVAASLAELTQQVDRFVTFHVPRPPAVDPQQLAQAAAQPAVDVAWVDDAAVADWQRMEQVLTQTLGMPPTDEQVFEAFRREDRLPGRGQGSFPRPPVDTLGTVS